MRTLMGWFSVEGPVVKALKGGAGGEDTNGRGQ